MAVISGLDLVIVTGLSGAGKTKTMGYLEDLGYYAMDNLPISLMSQFLDLALQTNGKITKIAVALDVRSSGFKTQFHSMLQHLKARGVHPRIIFLEARRRSWSAGSPKREGGTRSREPPSQKAFGMSVNCLQTSGRCPTSSSILLTSA